MTLSSNCLDVCDLCNLQPTDDCHKSFEPIADRNMLALLVQLAFSFSAPNSLPELAANLITRTFSHI